MNEAQRTIQNICGELKLADAAVVETRAQIERPDNPMNAAQIVFYKYRLGYIARELQTIADRAAEASPPA
jgi:hypothetical protein